jgi:hypothetical protein
MTEKTTETLRYSICKIRKMPTLKDYVYIKQGDITQKCLAQNIYA